MFELVLLMWIGSRIDAPAWYFFQLGAVIIIRFLGIVATWYEKIKNDEEEF